MVFYHTPRVGKNHTFPNFWHPSLTSELAGGWPAKGTGDPCRVGGGEVTPLLRLEMEEVGVRRVVGWEGRK